MAEAGEEVESLPARHRRELKELRGKIQALKKSVPKGDKKKKKEVTETIARLENELSARHEKELKQADEGGLQEAVAAVHLHDDSEQETEGAELPAIVQPAKASKAQRRREKKAQAEREREARVIEGEKDSVNSERTKEKEALRARLKDLGLRVQEVESDGHCLYYALACQLQSKADKPAVLQLRRQAADYMLSHRNDFLPFVAEVDVTEGNEDPLKSYCEKVSETAAWGGELEIRAISQVLEVPIVVYQAYSAPLVVGDKFGREPLKLSYHRHEFGLGEHYNAVVPNS